MHALCPWKNSSSAVVAAYITYSMKNTSVILSTAKYIPYGMKCPVHNGLPNPDESCPARHAKVWASTPLN
jgi:hypothetical protein